MPFLFHVLTIPLMPSIPSFVFKASQLLTWAVYLPLLFTPYIVAGWKLNFGQALYENFLFWKTGFFRICLLLLTVSLIFCVVNMVMELFLFPVFFFTRGVIHLSASYVPEYIDTIQAAVRPFLYFFTTTIREGVHLAYRFYMTCIIFVFLFKEKNRSL